MQLLSQNSLRYIKVFNVLEKNRQSAANFYETAKKNSPIKGSFGALFDLISIHARRRTIIVLFSKTMTR